jgi:hypothetical protein
VQAVAGQLAGCHVGPDLARLGARGEQVSDQVLELLPCPVYVLAAVQQRYGPFGAEVCSYWINANAVRTASGGGLIARVAMPGGKAPPVSFASAGPH